MKKLQRGLSMILLHATLWLWRLLVLSIILLAVLIAVGREMAPLLKDNKAWLEQHLTALSGYPVQMASVEAQWEGLTPELRVTQLTAGEFIMLDKTMLRVDLLGSAWHRQLVFDALTVEGASLTIPIAADDLENDIDIQTALNFLFGGAHIHLQNIFLRLQRGGGDELLVQIPDLDVGNHNDRHWMQGSVLIADANQPIEITGAFTGSASDVLAGDGRVYLDVGDGSKLRKVMAFVVNKPDLPLSITEPGGIQGRMWLDWHDNDLNWTAATSIHNLNIDTLGYRVSYAGNLTGKLHIHQGLLDSLAGLSGYELTMEMPRGELVINQKTYPVPDWALHYQSRYEAMNNEAAVSLHIPQFDLQHLEDYRPLITHPELRSTLNILQPRGLLRHITLTAPLDKKSAFKPLLRANLEQVSVSAWEGAPALKKVDAYLEASTYAGFVEVDSKNGFSMHFPDLYTKAMSYQSVRGRVYWNVNPVNNEVFVGSEAIDLEGEEDDDQGRAAFWVDIPSRHSHRANEMYLSVGLKGATVADRYKYLPNTLPRSLQHWLNSSIKEGEALENGFIYRGSLRSNEEHEHSFLYFGKLKNGILKFDPAWPALLDAQATVLVDNGDVHADVKKASLQGITLEQATVEVKSGNFLTIQGEVEGDGNRALDVLRKTPLRQTLGSTFDAWQLKGDINGRISLGIALDHNTQNDFQEVAITLNHNDLILQDINLPLDRLTGDFFYSNSLGLSAASLSAQLWKQPLAISITPVPDQDGLPDILINTTVAVEPAQLAAWSHLSFIRFLQGSIPVQGKLAIPLDIANDSVASNSGTPPFASLDFSSDLQGVVLELPAPLKKSPGILQPLVLKVDLFKDHQAYDVLYGSQVAAKIEMPTQGALRGQVWINQVAEKSTTSLPEGLNIYGHLEKAVLQDWIKVIERYAKLETGQAGAPAAAHPVETPSPAFQFTVDDFLIGDLSLGSTTLAVARFGDNNTADSRGWRVNFSHAAADGNYQYFDQAGHLPELEFDRLDIDTWRRLQGEDPTAVGDDKVEKADPLAEVVPQDLPALKVRTKKLIYGGTDLGQWRFTIQPASWGAAFENFSAQVDGFSIGAISGDEGATLLWRRDKDVMETEISARISQVGSHAAMTSLFQTDRVVEAKKTDIAASLVWEGSPIHMQFKNLVGDVRISSENGRFLNSTTSTDLMRVINVFNFNAWARRLKLDFSDLYKKGVSYDRLDGHVRLDHGKVVLDEPLVMVSPSSNFVLQGTIDSMNNSINADLVVTLPVGDNATWITALAGGLPAAVGVWAVSKIFAEQIDNLSSISYGISGELDDPVIQFKRITKAKSDKDKKNLSPAPVLPVPAPPENPPATTPDQTPIR